MTDTETDTDTETAILFTARIFTDDVDRLVRFYETVTGLTAERLHPLFAEVPAPSGTLAIASTETVPLLGPDLARAGANRSVSLDFLIKDVDSWFETLRASGVESVNEPTTMPWGNRSLLLRDPDGNLVNLFTPTTPAARKRFGLDDLS